MPTFIDHYRVYTEKQESPSQFHIWTALSVLLAAMRGEIRWDLGPYAIYPNEYILLVAGSAKCRKNGAIKMGQKLLDQMDRKPPIFAQKITPEALLVFLQEVGCRAYVVAPEFPTFLGNDAVGSGLVTILTALYDCPSGGEWSYQTISRGNMVLDQDVCINILGGSTPQCLRQCLSDAAITGGFASRVLFIYGDKPRHRNAFPIPDREQKEAEKKLVEWLNKLSEIKGEFELTDEAKEYFSEWYEDEIDRLDTVGYYGRKHTHVLKVALALSMGESLDLVIELSHIRAALGLLNVLEKGLPVAVAEIGTTIVGSMARRVYEIIADEGTIDHSLLARKTYRYMDANDLKGVIETLESTGKIRTELQGRRRQYIVVK